MEQRTINDWIMYHELHRLLQMGFSLTRVANYLVIDWRTAKKYANMSEVQYEHFLLSSDKRSKILDPYEDFVLSKLREYPDTSAAQILDWLKENFQQLPEVNPKTVYNFVMAVRQQYHIPVTTGPSRQFGPVPEAPYGEQAQVDFGQYNMKNTSEKVQKVYFFSMVLSRSRMKYCYFQDSPYTAADVCNAHERAFAFFDGIAHTLVYDQDKTMLHDENSGQLILTSTFSSYAKSRKFNLHFCRKSDPQSKGKIENVIRYIKRNFLYNRKFYDIDQLNVQAVAWLARTANYMHHNVTQQRPCDVFKIEKEYLIPFVPIAPQPEPKKLYTVRKTNEINYRGNFYSLPSGTYKDALSKVGVLISKRDGVEWLDIYNAADDPICTHKISYEKGKKIINTNHRRDTSHSIDQMMDHMSNHFSRPDVAMQYFESIRQNMPRYIRDQLLKIRQVLEAEYPRSVLDKTLNFCLKNDCYTASDFEDVLFVHLSDLEADIKAKGIDTNQSLKLPVKAAQKPSSSNINDYELIINPLSQNDGSDNPKN